MRSLLLVLALLVATSLAPHAQSSRSARGSGAAPAAPARAIVHATPQARVPGVSESFDDITTLPGSGWSQQNLSSPVGSTSWFQGNAGVFPAHSGAPNAYIGANFNNTSDVGTISNWLITPEVDLANGTTMTFYTRTVDAPAYPDRLEVRLSTNGASTDVGTTDTSVGDFATLMLTVNPDLSTSGYPNTWTQYTVTVSSLGAPTTGRFALRYFVPNGGPFGTNSDYIGIDDVVVTPAAFSFVQPTAGQPFRVGNYLKAIWDSPPPAPANVVLSLRKGTGPYEVIYSGPNLEQPNFGAARYLIPTGTPAGDDYNLKIEDAANPSTFALSDLFSITDPAGVYTFTSPIRDETFAIGSTQTVSWDAPAGASGAGVTLALFLKSSNTFVTALQTADDGSEVIDIPANAPADRYYLTITDDGNPAYTGTSPRFRLAEVAVVTPVAGTTYGVGQTISVAWQSPAITDPAATAQILLRGTSSGTTSTVVARSTENDGAFDFAVPPGTVDGTYFVQVKVRTSGLTYTARSGEITITSPVAPVAGHFVPSVMWGTASSTLAVAAPGLADGSEIGAFLGGRLVGAGVVRGGVADVLVRGSILVPALVVDNVPAADDFVYVADGTALSLRSFSAGVEQALETTAAVSFVDGAETAVTLKGGAAQTAAAASLTVAAFPNPATTSATVRFAVGTAQAATVTVYDLLGRAVATAFDAVADAGTTEVSLSTQSLPAGVYVVRVTAGAEHAAVRLTVVR